MKTLALLVGYVSLAGVCLAQTPVQFNTRYLTGGNLNRKITVEPAVPWIKSGTNLIGGRALQLHPVNGLVTTNLVPADYWVSIDGSNERLKMSVPDTNVTLQAVSLMVDVPTYYYTNTAVSVSGFTGTVTNWSTISTSTNVGFTLDIDSEGYLAYNGYYYRTNVPPELVEMYGAWSFMRYDGITIWTTPALPGMWLISGSIGGSAVLQIECEPYYIPVSGMWGYDFSVPTTVTESNLTSSATILNLTTFTNGLCTTNLTVAP